jgi:hypothetical protein
MTESGSPESTKKVVIYCGLLKIPCMDFVVRPAGYCYKCFIGPSPDYTEVINTYAGNNIPDGGPIIIERGETDEEVIVSSDDGVVGLKMRSGKILYTK